MHRKIGWALFRQELNPLMLMTIILAFVFSQPVLPWFKEKVESAGTGVRAVSRIVTYCATACLMVLCLLYLSAGTYSPFIYLNF
jgi:alginate O-acetyltransferase complex protein AlgI